jgi:hypothetical protein
MERYGYTIFCDEIRNEAGGKLSFIGCYNAVMFTGSKYPIVLPKFCTHFHIFSPANQPYTSVLARCYLPGETEPIAEESIAVPALREQQDLVDGLPEGVAPPFIVVAASLVFEPLELSAAGLIQIRAVINNGPGELHLGSLQVLPAQT